MPTPIALRGGQTMTQGEKFPDFEAYLQDLLRRSRRSISESKIK
jgi:hypothetical protein